MFRKIALAITFGVIVPLLIVSVASAIEIVVDGVRETAWNGAGSVTDPNEPAITDGYDIDTFQWTNGGPTNVGGSGNMFFLISTYANTITTGFPPPTIVICLNTDNNTA